MALPTAAKTRAGKSGKGRTASKAVSPVSVAPVPTAARPLRLEWVEAGSLVENPNNWRTHPDGQMGALKDVINDPEIGWAGACLFNEKTGRLIDGHARRNAVDPKTPIPVLIGSWSEEAEKKILLTLDPLAGMAVPDVEQLTKLLDEVKFDSPELVALSDGLRETLNDLEQKRLQGIADNTAPGDFNQVDENISTEHTCPKCGYKFSGGK